MNVYSKAALNATRRDSWTRKCGREKLIRVFIYVCPSVSLVIAPAAAAVIVCPVHNSKDALHGGLENPWCSH